MSTTKNRSRRSFIKKIGLASGGLMLGFGVPSCVDGKEEPPKDLIKFNPNLFVQLNSDGSLILVASRSEMGNGVRTSLTSVIADEMDADWNKVTVKQATGDAKFGNQNTDGSRSIRTLYTKMRELGATTRAMLIAAAAQKWKVPASECTAQNHFVIHSSGKKIGFGDLVEIAKTLDVPKEVSLKSPKKFKYIGKHLRSIDAEDYVNGTAVFGLDKHIEGMKYVAIKRCPVTFGTVKSFDKTAALKIAGVEAVIEIPRIKRPFGALGGVAVVANNTWAAFKGRDALEVEWDFGKNKNYNSERYMNLLTKNVHQSGKVNKETGNIKKAFKNAAEIVESTFQLPHLIHAPMEVPNAIAWVKEDSCEVWASTQTPQAARAEIVDYLKIDEAKVIVNVLLLGGGFGRKSKPDYVVEAVIASKLLNDQR